MSDKINSKKAVVLLSGGMDSATVTALAIQKGYKVHALSFLYGQKGRLEVLAAEAIAHQLGVENHTVLEIPLGQLGGSSLTTEEPVPTTEPDPSNIPSTYVPARNTIFLSYALALAEVIGASDIFIGTNSIDYSGYPDCRPEYLRAFEKLAKLATKSGITGQHFTIHSPLQKMDKAEIIRVGMKAGVQFNLTVSCYQPEIDGKACGVCESCRLRLRGFKEAGLVDPAVYKNR
jgi:7-cyano-7-deazaguanine synthase